MWIWSLMRHFLYEMSSGLCLISKQVSNNTFYHFITKNFTALYIILWISWSFFFPRMLDLCTQNLQFSIVCLWKKCITHDNQNWSRWESMWNWRKTVRIQSKAQWSCFRDSKILWVILLKYRTCKIIPIGKTSCINSNLLTGKRNKWSWPRAFRQLLLICLLEVLQ